MNIQINCKDTVSEDALRYIFHNLDFYKKQYEDSWEFRANKNYKIKEKGNWAMTRNIDITCNKKTMYFKIKE